MQFMKKTVFFGLLVILLAFSFIACDNDGDKENGNGKKGNLLSETTWEAPEPSSLPGSGGLRLIFINNTQQKETTISLPTIELANGTYVSLGNTVTITTVNYWNSSSLFPYITSWTGAIEGNKISYTDNGELYIFTKK